MKLRFHKGDLRLRLSQSDVARLAETGGIEERIDFPGRPLNFALQSGPEDQARFEGDTVRITAQADEIKAWIESDREGISFEQAGMKVAIEKDFRCVHRDSPEDTDSFPNPMMDRF